MTHDGCREDPSIGSTGPKEKGTPDDSSTMQMRYDDTSFPSLPAGGAGPVEAVVPFPQNEAEPAPQGPSHCGVKPHRQGGSHMDLGC